MKRIFALLFSLLMLFSFSGCGMTSEEASDMAGLLADVLIDSVVSDAGASGDLSPQELLPDQSGQDTMISDDSADADLPIDGVYTSKADVALYIHLYGMLPDNFITKKEAQALGWTGGSLEPYAPGKCIGGSHFGNYEGLLPEKEGRTYWECDVDTLGAEQRGAKRIVYSNDGLIYYTGDHYESFELLYGEE